MRSDLSERLAPVIVAMTWRFAVVNSSSVTIPTSNPALPMALPPSYYSLSGLLSCQFTWSISRCLFQYIHIFSSRIAFLSFPWDHFALLTFLNPLIQKPGITSMKCLWGCSFWDNCIPPKQYLSLHLPYVIIISYLCVYLFQLLCVEKNKWFWKATDWNKSLFWTGLVSDKLADDHITDSC